MKTKLSYFIVTAVMLFCALAPVSASDPVGNASFLTGVDLFDPGFLDVLSPSEQIADILAFYDDAVAQGTLQWAKEGKFPETMRNMIESAAQSINQGNFARASNQLEKIRNCFYFDNKPPERITGPAMITMVEKITVLLQTLQHS